MDKRILLTLALGAMSQVFAHAWEPKGDKIKQYGLTGDAGKCVAKLSQTAVATGRMDQSEWIVEVCRNGSEHVPEECFL